MKVGLVLAVTGLLSVGSVVAPRPLPSARAAENRTNVLIIVTDDQRFDSLMVMPKTQRLLVQKGVQFTNAFATTPACCPSRASIFTGQYVHNHGVTTNDGTTTLNLDHSTTLQARLQEQGYKTALFGKYLNGWGVEVPPPYFDRWAVMSGFSALYYRNNTWNIDGRQKTVARYSTHFIERQTTDFISSRPALRNPWLTYVTFTAPHAPFEPERKYRRAPVPPFTPNPAVLEQDRSDKPPWVQERQTSIEVVKRQRRGQFRTLMSVDDSIAKIMRVLRATGQARNTLVIFTSDNGYLHGEHSLQGKTTPYMPSVRVPLLLRWPLGAPQGASDDRLVANIDIAPTIMDALDLPVDPLEMDGRSLLDRSWARDRLLLEYWARPTRNTPDWGGMITTDHQYIEYYEDEDFGGEPLFAEYYNISLDPYQLENLIPRVPERPATLPLVSQQLDADRNCRGTEGPEACP
ncbi:MAG: sulfatase [Actinomycetota bacterium]